MSEHRTLHHTTGDPVLDIIAAVVRRALRDAKRDERAARWVDDFIEGLKQPELAIVANEASGNYGISENL